MRPNLLTAGAGLVGLIIGALVVLSLPTSGQVSPERSPAALISGSIGQAPVPTLLAWTPGHLPAGLADAARAIDGVEAVAEVRSGIAWLDGWAAAGGGESRPPEGLMVPLEVAAIDPVEYSAFVPPAERPRFLELQQGPRALAGTTGARLRGIGDRGSIRFGDNSIEVTGVVDDGLIGAHEAVVSRATGAGLGVTAPRYLLISLGPGASRALVEGELAKAVPAGTRIRVRAPGETPVFRHGDAVLALAQVKEMFGEFAARPGREGAVDIDPAWVEDNISSAEVPVLGEVRCHKSVLPQVIAAMEEVARRGLSGLIRADDYGGCFSARYLNANPEAGLSHHAWGIALDLNVSANPFGAEPTMDPRVVEIFERWGLAWGGRWLVPDGMHFEFLRWPLSPKG